MKKETEFMVLDVSLSSQQLNLMLEHLLIFSQGAMCCIAVILMTIFHPAIFFPQISKKYVIAQHAKAAEADDELGLAPNHAPFVEKEPIQASGSMELAQGPASESEEEVMGRRDVNVDALGHVSR